MIYSRYFTSHVAGGQRWLWGLAVSLSMVFAALLAPPLGAAADFSRNRKRFLLLFTLACVVCTGLMFFVRDGMVLTGMLLFVAANIGFEGGLVFYDAFLPGLTGRSSYGRVSGYGFAMGYVGALAVLLLVMLILPAQSDPDYLFRVRLSFVVAALFVASIGNEAWPIRTARAFTAVRRLLSWMQRLPIFSPMRRCISTTLWLRAAITVMCAAAC